MGAFSRFFYVCWRIFCFDDGFFRAVRPLLGEFFVKNIAKTGTEALPIVGWLLFLVGVVLAYQTGDELRRFGANIFIVDLLGFLFFASLVL